MGGTGSGQNHNNANLMPGCCSLDSSSGGGGGGFLYIWPADKKQEYK